MPRESHVNAGHGDGCSTSSGDDARHISGLISISPLLRSRVTTGRRRQHIRDIARRAGHLATAY